MWFDWADTDFGDVVGGEAIGRSAWLVTAIHRRPGKVPHDLAFDRDSGALLYMRSSDGYLGFEELFVDEEIDDETFRWDGPVEPTKVGSALVISHEDRTYSVTWEVSVKRRPVYRQDGPMGITRNEAIAWADARAARTRFRTRS